MSDTTNTPRPYVLRALDQDPLATTASVTQRQPAITTGTVGAQQMCTAYGVSAPGTSRGAHHHADTETAAYVLSGTVRNYFGTTSRNTWTRALVSSCSCRPASSTSKSTSPTRWPRSWLRVRRASQ